MKNGKLVEQPKFQRLDTMTWPEMRDELERLRRAVRRFEREARERRDPTRFIDGKPLRPALVAVGWSASALAAAVPCGAATVMRWARGDGKLSVERARRVVEVFREAGAAPPVFPRLVALDDGGAS